MQITLLGTGTPAPSLTRQSSGYLLEIGDDVIVIDHGPGAAHRLLQAGKTPRDVTHLFLSHLHYDHIADYPRLVLQRWDSGAGTVGALPIHGPAPLATVHERFFGADGAFEPDIRSRVSHQASLDVFAARGGEGARTRPSWTLHEIAVGDVVEGRDWRMTVGRAQHFEPYLTCLAFRFDTAAGSIVYSGDNGGITEDMIDLARDCDILIHMCHFATGDEPSTAFRAAAGGHLDVAETAAKAGAKTLALTHLTPLMDRPGLLERLVGEMTEIYHGEIIIGRDLLTLSPGATRVATID
ncbi:MAG: MBL fold metallo-hydrolase [Pseudomonadota bacterium]